MRPRHILPRVSGGEEVAVKVVHQLLVSPIVVDLADVTQLVPLDTTQHGPAAKRRRVSSAEQQRGFCLESLLAEVAGTEDGQHRGGDARVAVGKR